jgi:formamidopyrimidine-DNA glycosylase
MPELPEVEAARQLVDVTAAGRQIVGVWAAPDRLVLDGVTPGTLRAVLTGRIVRRAHRHGKHLWIELDRRPWPVFHFGMSGGFHSSTRRGVRLVSSRWDADETAWPPRFTKLHLQLAGGAELAFADARRLGRIRLRRDPRAEPPVSALGFDALRELPSTRRLRELLAGRSAPMKAVLLDQSFAAGVGNWIADEVLFQAAIDPRRRANTLTAGEVERLRRALHRVVTTAVRLESDSDRYPRRWLFHYRWGRQADAVTARGDRIRHITVAGRTTAWVPTVQR